MNKSVQIALGVAAVAMLIVVVVLGVMYQRQSARYAETRNAEETVRNQFNAALVSIAEIQDSLNSVVPAEEQIVHLAESSDMGTPVTQSQKDQMLGTISNLKESVRNSRERIKELEKSLKGSQAKVAGLQRVIDNLKQSVVEKEATIARLSNTVESLTSQVAGLESEVRRGAMKMARQDQQLQSKGREIEEKRSEIGTIFYIVGTRKELKDKGVITASGGVAGLGKSDRVSGSFREEDFRTLDTDSQTEVPILGTEPEVLSSQSKASYSLEVGSSSATLKITDAAEFRKVKYLVVVIKERK
jgi:uncharacterized protein YoxC